jgi:hypothetical protein
VTDPVKAIADAVLYEGYVLWPYRRSALKNTKRWTFGCVFPRAHSELHPDDRCVMRAQVLVEGDPAVDVGVRFLQVVHRQAMRGDEPVDALGSALTWDEAVERECGPGRLAIAAGREAERVDGGALVRSWHGLEGAVDVATEPLGGDLSRVTVTVANTTPWSGDDRAAALERAFCSTHAVLRAASGAFVSSTDPPEHHRAHAEACVNEGCWPVLVGEPGSADTVLVSPIILEDHPRIAPESPGDLFDGGEIDQMLVLNILTLTDAEKAEMRDSDPRTREILERTEALTPEQLTRLSGAIREFGLAR